MHPNRQNNNHISRKKFLRVSGSVIAGGSILGISGHLLRKRVVPPTGTTQGAAMHHADGFSSPYRKVSSFTVPENIETFELAGENMLVATANNIHVYNRGGALIGNFATGSNLRDIAFDGKHIYLLFPRRLEVYDVNGQWVREWGACSDKSDYCSMALAPGAVFVTDAALKNICKYTDEGNFVKFIDSPHGFIIPSYSFGITHAGGVIYCSNSGRHQVEKYSVDGKYTGCFGKAGGAPGMFCGCCNPVHITHTASGEIITSEKGNPRISCYSANGDFHGLLLDSKALGGGNAAVNMKVDVDTLFIAAGRTVSVFRYDRRLAANTACSRCTAHCPLQKGLTI